MPSRALPVLLLAGVVAMTTPVTARAQTPPNGFPWFQSTPPGAKVNTSEVLDYYLSLRRLYTGRAPRVAICTKVSPVDIPPLVMGEFNRRRFVVDSIWIDPTCPAGPTEREVIAGEKGPYELVRITTLVVGWETSFIETIVEPADSPGGVGFRAYRERFTLDHREFPRGSLEVFDALRPFQDQTVKRNEP